MEESVQTSSAESVCTAVQTEPVLVVDLDRKFISSMSRSAPDSSRTITPPTEVAEVFSVNVGVQTCGQFSEVIETDVETQTDMPVHLDQASQVDMPIWTDAGTQTALSAYVNASVGPDPLLLTPVHEVQPLMVESTDAEFFTNLESNLVQEDLIELALTVTSLI